MDQYPTAEEEYEMMYGDELEMMDDDLDYPENPPPAAVENVPNTQPPQRRTQEIFPDSPALSQISRIDSINRRLFDESVSLPNASTPLANRSTLMENEEIPANPGARKRRLDLYGENLFSPGWQMRQQQKKQKREEDRDTRMIEQILTARKLTHDMANCKGSNLTRLEQLHRFKMQNLSYLLPNYPFQALSRSDGERIYVRTHNEEFMEKALEEVGAQGRPLDSLLGDAKTQIWDEAREIILRRSSTEEKPSEVAEEVIPGVQRDLWVEKYRPRRYRDLLSDETTNRCLLQWLKMWDKVVFNRDVEVKAAPGKPLNTFNKQTGRFESNGGWKKSFRTRNNLLTDRDALGRPLQKIALLSGAPGLGKTTLAHVIAHHAGYSVREVNASDERTPEAFRQVLEDGTQMKSLLEKENRPNCLVFDEIDGAPAASIELLIRFASDAMAPAQKGKKGAKVSKNVLKRPIICICNDIYTPSLRQLRQMALVVTFPPLNSERLAERLLTIASQEGVKTDFGALLSLCEKTGNDIRSCISMIQFFSATKKPLMLSDVLRGNIGQKDQHKGLFAIWASIFQTQRQKPPVFEENPTEVAHRRPSKLDTIVSIVQSGGDYERLTQGVFENYPLQKISDVTMLNTAEVTDWFVFSDLLQRMINQLQNYTIYPYLPYTFAMWHNLLATLQRANISFPSKGFEASQKLQTHRMLMIAMRKGLGNNVRGIGDGFVMLMDALPLIRRILSPNIRSVSLHLLTPKDRSDLQHAVEVMADLGVKFMQIKGADGTFKYQMEPDIELLSIFRGSTDDSPLSYWTRQLIAREVDLENMRRAKPKLGEIIVKKKPQMPNHLQCLQPRKVEKVSKYKEMVVKDFFGRVVTRKAPLSIKEGGSDGIVKSPIWYRFKEGYNNAVRKDITLSDLI
ncbi:chromosome transmission fidelity protein 18 homolog [Lutzomyia longipalpis]|uniref:chromosome transmission fidelity protein 18 homolog n=1 Tax=Lutzomyia longipalpis TaxID=7200 RepID=UPI0024834153|nr:chromosome transmission fidelity protein 18 homolog [Lutzomyia longipalpis]